MLMGIAQLAEGANRHRLANHAHVVLWTLTFGLVIAAGVLVLRRDRWFRRLAALVAALVVFQLLTLGQPPIGVGVVLVAAVWALLWWPARPRRTVGSAP